MILKPGNTFDLSNKTSEVDYLSVLNNREIIVFKINTRLEVTFMRQDIAGEENYRVIFNDNSFANSDIIEIFTPIRNNGTFKDANRTGFLELGDYVRFTVRVEPLSNTTKDYGFIMGSVGNIFDTNSYESTEAIVVEDHFPLYRNRDKANDESLDKSGSTEYEFDNIKYYMPNGLPANETFVGDYTARTTSQENEIFVEGEGDEHQAEHAAEGDEHQAEHAAEGDEHQAEHAAEGDEHQAEHAEGDEHQAESAEGDEHQAEHAEGDEHQAEHAEGDEHQAEHAEGDEHQAEHAEGDEHQAEHAEGDEHQAEHAEGDEHQAEHAAEGDEHQAESGEGDDEDTSEVKKILCLHGGGSSGSVLENQQGMQDLMDELGNGYEFVFTNSPESGGVWIRDPPGGKEDPTTDLDWADNSVTHLKNLIAANGPFYGILGYSQGAAMVILLLAHLASIGSSVTFERVILSNGYLPTTHQGLMDTINNNKTYDQDTLNFIGEQDNNFKALGLAINENNLFTNFQVLRSNLAGHNLPSSGDPTLDDMVNFIKNGVTVTIQPVDGPSEEPTDEGDDVTIQPVKSLIQFLNDENLTTFLDGIEMVELDVELNPSENGPFTIFVPTNDAFVASGIDLNNFTTPEGKEFLRGALQYHVHEGEQNEDEIRTLISNNYGLGMMNGNVVTLSETGGNIKINESTITSFNNIISNGLVHVIDTVLTQGDEEDDGEDPSRTS